MNKRLNPKRNDTWKPLGRGALRTGPDKRTLLLDLEDNEVAAELLRCLSDPDHMRRPVLQGKEGPPC
jgi:hypothetical protein